MIIAVINFSGNVGKTTIARYLLSPRLNHAEVIPIESVNADSQESEAMVRGKEYGALQRYLATKEHAVVDVGASNIEDFISLMQQFRGSHEEFDLFIVPTVPPLKQQRDTIATIMELVALGVAADKIRVLFNQIEYKENNLPETFSGLYAYYLEKRTFTLNPAAVLHTNELYSRLKARGSSIEQLLADNTDYKAAIRATEDIEEKSQLAYQLATRRLAAGVVEELDAAFAALMQ